MQRSTKKQGAILCAAAVILAIALYFGILLFAAVSEPAVLWLIAVLCAAIIGALVTGIVLALRQRLREIDGGEEEDACQY